MFKFNKKFLFVIFALCLFAIGVKISLVIENGPGKGNDLIFTIFLFFTLIISSIVIYKQIYKIKKNNKSK